MNNPITIVGVGAGFSYEDSGPTHHITEDLTIMRAMPRIQINSITDSVMASAFADLSCKMETTNYVRLDRQIFSDIYDKNADFTKGFTVLRESKDFYMISTGCMTHSALKIAENLDRKNIDIGVIDLYTFPVNASLLSEVVKGVNKLVTLEEHFLPGGLGSAVCEVLIDNSILVPVKRIGLSTDKLYCYKYGGREVIRGYYGLEHESIEKQVSAFILDSGAYQSQVATKPAFATAHRW